jgi:uncharacterized protein YbjT (DUF2867 family)
MILIVGATGLVGSEVCRILAGQGEKVRALVRTTSSKEKVDSLRSYGVDLCVGDLKNPASLASACRDVDSVVSTASSTLSRQEGDSIESVDAAGQMSLVNAAKAANVERFVFLSFRGWPDISFPVSDAKRAIEKAITSMNFTVIRATHFMEIWLSPALGFDYPNATVRVYGSGTSPISWVSSSNVAEMCALAVRHPAAERRMIEFGGPESLSQIEAAACFERIGGRAFKLDHVPEPMLRAQYEQATDPMQKSFAALMLGTAHGDAINMAPVVEQFGIKLTTVEQYARSVQETAAKA